MPFGLTNAPATFQYIMNSVLEPYLRKFVIVFMDDILIYSKSIEEHTHHLRLVLQLLRKHQFYIKRTNCVFAQGELEYLGHIIYAEGVKIDPMKTQVMTDWPRPSNITELSGFLGLIGYYRKIVRHYGILARPLTNLLKKKQFLWDDEAQVAFDTLKKVMTTTPVLALPNFTVPFIVETGASDQGLGAVLMQHDKPIAFLSKTLSSNHKFLSIYEKEFWALIMVVERWRPYLQRQEFIIKIDHKSLAYLNEQTLQSNLQRNAMTRMMGVQFRIQYKKGKDNLAADALSRINPLMQIQSFSKITSLLIHEVINTYANDPHAQELLAQLAVTSPNAQGYSLHQGIIRQGEQIWIGDNSALRTKLISTFHSTALGGGAFRDTCHI
jgi:hypothetical protein